MTDGGGGWLALFASPNIKQVTTASATRFQTAPKQPGGELLQGSAGLSSANVITSPGPIFSSTPPTAPAAKTIGAGTTGQGR